MSAAVGNTPDHVSIRAKGHTLGHNGLRLSNRLSSRIQVHLAGYAAEHVLTGRRVRQLRHEVGLALLGRIDPSLCDEFEHFDERDGCRVVNDVLRTALLDDEEVWREVDRYYDVTRESLTAAWETVESVANALLKHDELDRDGVREALGVGEIYTLVFAVQRRHVLKPRQAAWPGSLSCPCHGCRGRARALLRQHEDATGSRVAPVDASRIEHDARTSLGRR